MTRPTREVVIVGGGSAGWLTAAVIAAGHGPATGVRVTLIESPDVAPIGVGEGTWPTMRDTLRLIGVSETDFLRECDASFKQGTRFDGWVHGAAGDYYYHPFVLPHGYTEVNLVDAWLAKHSETPFADLVSFQPHLCARGKAPKQAGTPEFAAVANYAYHLDAGKFATFLRGHCVGKLGIRHVVDHVAGIKPADNGDIAALLTASQGELGGDLFVDCSGFASLLLGNHYGVPFVSQQHVLLADRAIAIQAPYADANAAIASQTVSTARDAGWIWDIGLPSRRGTGYVYSSACLSDEQAELTLRRYIEESGGVAADALPEARRISIAPGHREQFWHRNCVAVGLSAGFVEPLEASALVLVELSAAMISEDWPADRDAMDIVGRRFNARFRYRWARIIDFLKLHYVLSRRTGGDFWIGNRQASSIPDRLQELLALWKQRPPSRYDFHQVEEVFPSASHQYVLYGMGFRPEAPAGAADPDAVRRAERYFLETAKTTDRMLAGLPANRALLDTVRDRPLPRLQ